MRAAGWRRFSATSPCAATQRCHSQEAVCYLVKALSSGPSGTREGAIQVRGAGRYHEQAPALMLTVPREFGGELPCDIDLHGSNAERRPLLEVVEELRRLYLCCLISSKRSVSRKLTHYRFVTQNSCCPSAVL